MSADTFRRRAVLPEPPRGEIMLQSPPALPRGSSQVGMQLMFMLPMMLGMGAMSFVYIGRSGGAMTWIFGALYISAMVGMLAMGLSRGGASKKAQINDERRDYLRYLSGLRGQVREVAVRQREAALAALPDPADLWSFAGTERLWERARTDPDFGRVRVGTGPQRLATALRAPQTAPLEDLDPVASTSLRHFIRTYATVGGLPVAVSLRSFQRVTLAGDRPEILALARALLAHLVTFHSPENLRIAACVGPDRQDGWDWLKWLPHSVHAGRADASGPTRLVAPTLSGVAALLADDPADPAARGSFTPGARPGAPHLLIVLDGAGTLPDAGLAPPDGLAGTTILDIGGGLGADAHALDLVIAEGRLGMRTADGVSLVGVPDQLSVAGAEVVARQLTALHTGTPAASEQPLSTTFGLADLLGIGDPRRLDPAVTWRPRSARDRLRIPIGVDPDGRPVDLDLKESAEGGMGPHGLVIGATGSGKSELLRTLVTGLAATHSSETLNLALIDFKGGATFAGMTGLPHTCAVITNLAADLTLVDRMADALRGELVRRQELLRAAGNYASVRDYERARTDGAPLQPLPSLLVIIDEFSELLSSRPEFIDLFVMIGRLGRSLGVHLMLASQRLEEGRLRGLDSHLSYRIGLRTFSAAESRAVLGVSDAYELPPVPGSAYLKWDITTLQRFKAAYVSGELPPEQVAAVAEEIPYERRVLPFGLAPLVPAEAVRAPAPATGPDTAAAKGETVLSSMIGRLVGNGPAAHQIWLPPLAEAPALDQLLPPLGVDPRRGLTPVGWTGNGQLTVPLAIVDKPFEQRRDLLWAELSGAAGHGLVLGAPQTGKSTLLRTLVAALALTHTPTEVQFFLLDLGGGGLASLSGLPHVSGYANRMDTERVRRIVAELTGLLAEREQSFAAHGIDSISDFRRRPPPSPDGRTFGDVFLVVDGWMALRQEFEQLEEAVTTLAARGLGFGLHVVLSANRAMEIRPALRDLIGTHVELRLGDPADSAYDRRAAADVPKGAPGRGLTADKLHFLGGLPRIDGRTTVSDLPDGASDLVKQVDASWHGPRAPQVRLLPRLVPATDLPASVPGDRRIPIGLAEADLGPAYLDFDADPHFLAFGDVESGKTGLLRVLAQQIAARYPVAEAAVIVADYRRGLVDALTGPHLLGYAGSEPVLTQLVAEAAEGLRRRLPGPEVTATELRERSWWKGPELFVLVDDYDLVVSPSHNPLAPLLEFLPQAKDVGLHLVLTRRSGGASRSLFEPVVQRLRDLGTPGLLLSGSRDEGALLADVKPSKQPPGRGQLVDRRTGVSLVQLAWAQTDPA
ncbi:DNA segregation ATPase FtsK/SpoIIIE, S-DNA-T family [Micromonospora pallida]|uniref:DNA segregation ATPase FtsK/SpoIIIE, S-DNA-T family n=1 Tax=Micromonospora pallida TaxID=145854 RepID=A0A1C6RV62_9ACTN|nr:type VII secretion protein EccCa [Micromonospora pallida]SCL20949.1 DNA segregation ATPase FtsK/SpoIIIE, S-DNA-T family [Micromonospora pallida]